MVNEVLSGRETMLRGLRSGHFSSQCAQADLVYHSIRDFDAHGRTTWGLGKLSMDVGDTDQLLSHGHGKHVFGFIFTFSEYG